MSILTLLSGWQTKVIAGLTFALGIVTLGYKYKSSKLEKVEHELDMHDKKEDMEDEQEEFIDKAMAIEQDEIIKEMNDDKKNRHDDVNSL